jgi:hypothetical protein
VRPLRGAAVKDRMSAKEYRAGGARLPTETQECRWLVDWADATRWNGIKISHVLVHVPNGAFHGADRKAGAVVARKLREQGLKEGVYDYIVPVPIWSARCSGLWLEMKRTKGGRVSGEQRDFSMLMKRFGWRCEVAKGWVEASAIIQDHLKQWERRA